MPTQADFQAWQQERKNRGEDPNDAQAWTQHASNVFGSPVITGGSPTPAPAVAPAPTAPPASPSPGSAVTIPSGNVDQKLQQLLRDQANMLDAVARGNREQFDEAKRQFEATRADLQAQFEYKKIQDAANFSENQRQFNTNQGNTERQQYGNVAMGLMNTAASLRGPEDYLAYQQNLNSGKALTDELYGSTPRPTFAAPSEPARAVSLAGILERLGLLKPGDTATPGNAPVPAAVGAPAAAPTVQAPASAPTSVFATPTSNAVAASPTPEDIDAYTRGNKLGASETAAFVGMYGRFPKDPGEYTNFVKQLDDNAKQALKDPNARHNPWQTLFIQKHGKLPQSAEEITSMLNGRKWDEWPDNFEGLRGRAA